MGLAPMYQALWKLLGTPGDERQVVLMYGNKSVEDILLKDELSAWSKKAAGRLKLVHVVGNGPDDPAPPGWADTPEYIAETGWIDKAKIQKYCFPPAEDTLLFVCGLPPMYDILCGPRRKSRRARCCTSSAIPPIWSQRCDFYTQISNFSTKSTCPYIDKRLESPPHV